jgi:NAD(P)-dependent dehydrogenase (short-subunit alcohol dehydrogenase family)
MKFQPGLVAMITGAGSGIGLETARLLISHGVAVVGIGRRSSLSDTLAEIPGSKNLVAALQQDITERDSPQSAVAFAMERFGRLDFLVNNAGRHHLKPVVETDDETLDSFIDVHLRAPFRYAREALRVMKAGSAIVNVSSCLALRGRQAVGIYGAVKAGQIGLTKQLAAEHGAHGIRSNAIAPGVILTAATENRVANVRFKRLMMETIPSTLPHGSVDLVAEAIVYLCSPSAKFVNGHVLVMDGGWSETHFLSDEALKR